MAQLIPGKSTGRTPPTSASWSSSQGRRIIPSSPEPLHWIHMKTRTILLRILNAIAGGSLADATTQLSKGVKYPVPGAGIEGVPWKCFRPKTRKRIAALLACLACATISSNAAFYSVNWTGVNDGTSDAYFYWFGGGIEVGLLALPGQTVT